MANRHATIMDAFNAAGGVVRQAAPLTDEMRRKNQLDAGRAAGEVHTSMQNYLRDNPWNYKGDPENAEELQKYRNEYQEQLNRYTDSLYATAHRNNNSAYYRDLIGRQRTDAHEKNRNHVLDKEDEWRRGYAINRYQRNIQGYLETMDPKSAWEYQKNELELLATTQEITPEMRKQLENNYARALREKFSTDRYAQVNYNINNPAKLTAQMKAAKADIDKTFSEFMPAIEIDIWEDREVLDEEGNVTGTERVSRKESRAWSYEGMKEAEEKLMHDTYFGIISEVEGSFQRLKIKGPPDKAIRLGRLWGAYHDLTYDPNNEEEYGFSNSTYRHRTDGYFNWPMLESALRSSRGSGGSGDKLKPKDVDPKRWVQSIDSGNFSVLLNAATGETTGRHLNHMEALDSWLYHYEDAWRGQYDDPDGIIADLSWTNELFNALEKYETELKNIVEKREDGKDLWNLYERLKNSAIYEDDRRSNPYRITNREDRNNREQFTRNLMLFATDMIYSGVGSKAEMETRMRSIIVGEVDRRQRAIRTNSNRNILEDPELINKMADYHHATIEGKGKDQVFSITNTASIGNFTVTEVDDEDVVWLRESFKENFMAVRSQELTMFRSMMGLPADTNVNQSIMLSEDNERDPIPKGIFIIESGPNAGTYRVNYDKDNRNNPFVEYLDDDDKWVSTEHLMERPMTRNEQRQTARRQRRAEQAKQRERDKRMTEHWLGGGA